MRRHTLSYQFDVTELEDEPFYGEHRLLADFLERAIRDLLSDSQRLRREAWVWFHDFKPGYNHFSYRDVMTHLRLSELFIKRLETLVREIGLKHGYQCV